MSLLKNLFGASKTKEQIQSIIEGGQYHVIDVRTPAEFSGGAIQASNNIPLNKIKDNLSHIKSLELPIILCCASGIRSGQATTILKKEGIEEAYNGGSWKSVHKLINATD